MAIGRCQEIRAKNADHELNLILGKRLMNMHLKGCHTDAQEGSEEFDGERHGWIGLHSVYVSVDFNFYQAMRFHKK